MPRPALRPASRLPVLDALRGLAVTLVFLGHVEGPATTWNIGLPEYIPPWRFFLMAGGHTGVALFFVLSGFLLAPPFLVEIAGNRRVARAAYALRRFRRVFPAYAAAVLFAVAMTSVRWVDLARAVPFLLFLQGVPGLTDPIPSYGAVWWSLSTEVQFYVLLPLVSLVVPTRWWWPTLAAVALAYLAVIPLGFGGSSVDARLAWSQSVLGRAPAFVAGIAAAWWWVRRGAVGSSLVWGVSFLAAVLGTLNIASPALRLLNNAGFRFLGKISYTIYLIHLPIIDRVFFDPLNPVRPLATSWYGPHLERALIAAGLCIVLGWIGYRTLEQPFASTPAPNPLT